MTKFCINAPFPTPLLFIDRVFFLTDRETVKIQNVRNSKKRPVIIPVVIGAPDFISHMKEISHRLPYKHLYRVLATCLQSLLDK